MAAPALALLRVRDFSGGLNVRDAQIALANSESPDAWNVTFDERGGVGKRLGYVKYNPSVYGGGMVKRIFRWRAGGKIIVQAGDKLYEGTSTSSFKTFTTSARCGFADFLGKLYIIHPIDGLFTWDGATVTAIGAGPKGDLLLPWQNRLWASGDPGADSRLYYSDLGDGTSWPALNFNDIREKDSEPIICLAGASGIDVSGRPGMLAFKRESTYRVYDPDTGAYATIDPEVGAASALSVVNLYSRTIVLSQKGIYFTEGTSALRAAGEREQPLWTSTQLAFDQLDNWCAGAKGDRVRFSLTRAGSTANDLALEYHPLQGWISAGSNAMSCYALDSNEADDLIGGSPSVSGQAYTLDVGGSDDGADIESWFQTKWYEPASGIKARLRRANVIARGDFDLYVRKDYEAGQGTHRPVSVGAGGFVWGDPGTAFGDPTVTWGPSKVQDYEPVYSLGVARAVSFRIEETSSVSRTGQPILDGVAPTLGAWALFGIDQFHIPLGSA